MPISVDKKLKHFQNKCEELSNRKAVISELLLQVTLKLSRTIITLKLSRTIITLEQEIDGVVREIRELEEVGKYRVGRGGKYN